MSVRITDSVITAAAFTWLVAISCAARDRAATTPIPGAHQLKAASNSSRKPVDG